MINLRIVKYTETYQHQYKFEHYIVQEQKKFLFFKYWHTWHQYDIDFDLDRGVYKMYSYEKVKEVIKKTIEKRKEKYFVEHAKYEKTIVESIIYNDEFEEVKED